MATEQLVIPQRINERSSINLRTRAAAAYLLTVLVTLIVLIWVLKLWQADLAVPFVYAGDGAFVSSAIKGMIDNGWHFHNQYLGAPSGQTMLDYPTADNLHFLLIKAIGLFAPSFGVAINLFFLATFPLTAITSLFVFRRLRIAYPIAMMGSLLFTFLPNHIFRGEGQLFLSAIFIIPLSVLAIVRVCAGTPPFMKKSDSGALAFDFFSLRTAGYLAIALLTASAGLYYAFFAAFLLALAGLYAAMMNRSLKRLIVAGIIVMVIAAGLVANMFPSILYTYRYGKNEAVAQRQWWEADMYSTSIAHLLLPVSNHRVEFLRELKSNFMRGVYGENVASSLGIVGSGGLLFLAGWVVLTKRRYLNRGNDSYFRELDAVGALNLFAILVGTVGGLGTLFAYLVSPQIRAYNRISMYIGLFSIMGVLLALEVLREKYVSSEWRRQVFYGILLLILLGGIFDQTNSSMVPDYAALNQAYKQDEAFFQKVEASQPPQAMIFQLPYVAFPESPPVVSMGDYDHLKAYLHTKTLRWSYGAMKGREGDRWLQAVSQEPASQFLKDLAEAGFSGVYIDRYGYADRAAQIEQQLESELGVKPLVDDNNRRLFFDMRGYARSLGLDAS